MNAPGTRLRPRRDCTRARGRLVLEGGALVQLPPGPVFRWLPQIADVNPEAGAVDEQVDRPMARDRAKRELTERLQPPGQRRVVGNGDLHLKHFCQGTQEALGLPERKLKDHADRQSRLNRDVRVGTLAARQELTASSESQTVRSPRLHRPASYSGQLRIRYGDFAYWDWLRFGYFIGDDSGSGASPP
jgi:hypothetical protein